MHMHANVISLKVMNIFTETGNGRTDTHNGFSADPRVV